MAEINADDFAELRHMVGIDCLSLLDDDVAVDGDENKIMDNINFMEIIRESKTDRERFIAVCMAFDYQKKDVAYMLKTHPSVISRAVKKMRCRLIDIGYKGNQLT
jgi:hypothetical protein